MKSSTKPEDICLSAVIEKTSKPLKKALASLVPEAEIEEILQDSYLQLHLTARRESIANPVAFVHRTARNLAINRLRQKKTSERFVESHFANPEVNDQSEFKRLSLIREQQVLIDAINQLPPICRQVFVMRKLHGYSHKDISQRLSISTKTVENHLAKAIVKCRDYFVKQGADIGLISSAIEAA
jgi:RNA polymerase sigma factor (sigma-70 family)